MSTRTDPPRTTSPPPAPQLRYHPRLTQNTNPPPAPQERAPTPRCDNPLQHAPTGPAMSNRNDPSRKISAPRGTELSCKSWLTEAPYRMIQNNLDAEVAENPAELVVYGGIGRAARDWDCYDAILESLKHLDDNETLLVQSGKPAGIVPTHADAPRVLIANSNLVPH